MSSISVAGDVSGAISIAAPSAAGSGVLTLPTGTDTLVGKATTDTLTNKSIAATQLTGTIAASVLPAGSVLQVVQGYTSASFTTTSGTLVDITGLTATITPISSNSKILVMTTLNHSESASTPYPLLVLLRGATQIALGDAIGSAQRSSMGGWGGSTAGAGTLYQGTLNYLDSPATTSPTTYKWQVLTFSSRTFYFNRSESTADAQTRSAPSSIILMEVAG